MTEIDRFTDPWDFYGLRAYRRPERSRLLNRLRKIPRRDTIPARRGLLILRELLGEGFDRLGALEAGFAYQRLLVIEWSTGFKHLGFFSEAEIRDYALLDGPPQDSPLGHFWYGLLGGETFHEIEKIYRQLGQRSGFGPFRYSGGI